MKFMSLCSGIEAASVAWHPLGFQCLAVAEIEPFPCAVLSHHYPSVPNLGDITLFDQWPEEIFAECDVIVGGPPCQAFSVAGLRKGLGDSRGNLTLTYIRIVNHADGIRLGLGHLIRIMEARVMTDLRKADQGRPEDGSTHPPQREGASRAKD